MLVRNMKKKWKLPNNKKMYNVVENIKRKLLNKDSVYIISSDNQEILYLYSATMIYLGYRIILKPKNLKTYFDVEIESVFNIEDLELIEVKITGKWITGMFTSGSTSNPKLIAHEIEQVKMTLSWYERIYKINKKSLIISCMPVSYNFTFVAGVLNSMYVGCDFLYCELFDIIKTIKNNIEKYNKIILLANPIALEIMSLEWETFSSKKILIDSGGAPLSLEAIKWYREKNINIREGYGLTETCSLTHFDLFGNSKSIGTIGKPMKNVKVELINKENRPLIKIISNNIGFEVCNNGRIVSEIQNEIITTDIGRFNNGYLEIVGRYPDNLINGFWPKDTLNLISEIIGPKCALIQHLENKIHILLWHKIDNRCIINIKKIILNKIGIRDENIIIQTNTKPLLHSLKIQRKVISDRNK